MNAESAPGNEPQMNTDGHGWKIRFTTKAQRTKWLDGTDNQHLWLRTENPNESLSVLIHVYPWFALLY